METEGSLPHSQVSANCPYSEPARSSPYPPIPPHPTATRAADSSETTVIYRNEKAPTEWGGIARELSQTVSTALHTTRSGEDPSFPGVWNCQKNYCEGKKGKAQPVTCHKGTGVE